MYESGHYLFLKRDSRFKTTTTALTNRLSRLFSRLFLRLTTSPGAYVPIRMFARQITDIRDNVQTVKKMRENNTKREGKQVRM